MTFGKGIGEMIRGRLLKNVGAGRVLIRLNLEGVDLSATDLNGDFLCHTRLVGTELYQVHLREADLAGADLRRANLRGATVSRAQLRQVPVLDDTVRPDASCYRSEVHIYSGAV